MKDSKEVNAVVYDYGTFESLAEKLAETYAHVDYYTPFETEYRSIGPCCIGEGMSKATRLNEPISPDTFDEIDLWIFPDIGWGGFQRWLRSKGKAVWGHFGGSDYELYRTRFIKLLEQTGLPIVPYKKCVGITELAEYLKEVEDKWVKINVYREEMETWHHKDWEHSQRTLELLSVKFGGAKEKIVFIVQDPVDENDGEPVFEIGYDGWNVLGEYPAMSFQGYEKKNELYLGSCLKLDELPEEVRLVNESFTPVFKDLGYQCFASWEARRKGDLTYCIDPTFRMPGQTGEHLLETCSNLADVIWQGANGNLITPEFSSVIAVEATMHYTDDNEYWKTLRIPEGFERWFKLYRYCVIDSAYHFPPHKSNEVGVVLGVGETIDEAIQHLKTNFDSMEKEPVSINFEGFSELVETVKKAQHDGIHFTDEAIPEPSQVINEA